MWGVELVVILGMVAFNGVFAAYEIALASISLSRLHALAGAKKKGATAALYMKENMEGSLAGVQLGITLVGAIAAATGGVGAEAVLAPSYQQTLGVSPGMAEALAIASVVAPLTVVTIIFGELIPKVFALRNKEWVCLRLSPPVQWFVFAVWPVIWLLESTVTGLMQLGEKHLRGRFETGRKTEVAELQELQASVALARTSRLIGAQEEKIILGAAALSHRPIREVMLPASDIAMLDLNAHIHHALIAAHLDMHTRFPATERPGDPQAITGYVNFKDIVSHMRLSPQDPSMRGVLRAIPSLSAEEPVSSCLGRMIRNRTHIALVRNGANEVIGMVTLEDIIEELVGDIEDEFDHLPTHVIQSGSGWVVGGGVTPERLRQTTGVVLPCCSHNVPVQHLSDWVACQLPQPLQGGEVIEKENVRIAVRKVRRHKVLEAQVQRLLSSRT